MKTNNNIFDQKYVRSLLEENIYYDIVRIKQVIYFVIDIDSRLQHAGVCVRVHCIHATM